ncbi:methyltransferase domain-containing protein [Thiosocius teredinicola]|uniref:methyltransferase domain-containing protein n=1 Tax=Thiosocius teredinicola TaxID=1973002 RepID=UPI0009910596
MTDSNERKTEWEQRYDGGRTGWDRGEPSPMLDQWLAAGKVPEGKVLVPGCGHGHEVAELIHAGRQVTAVDIATQPVIRLMAQLAERDLHADVIQTDLLHWQPAEPFDAVYEQTCLCALDPGHWQAYAQRLADWLVPGGKLLALFMQTGREGGPPFDCPVADMRALFDDARWQWPDEPPQQVPHPNGLIELAYEITRR